MLVCRLHTGGRGFFLVRPLQVINNNHPMTERTRPSIRSTWRDAVGPPLTDKRIERYQLEGRYGDAAKQAAEERSAFRVTIKQNRVQKTKLKKSILKRYC